MIVEVAGVGSIELVESICCVFGSVAVNHVQEDRDSLTVALVDHFPQLVRSAVATGGCEKAGHLVAERGVVHVFHDSHHLDTVVAKVNYPRQCLFLEL